MVTCDILSCVLWYACLFGLTVTITCCAELFYLVRRVGGMGVFLVFIMPRACFRGQWLWGYTLSTDLRVSWCVMPLALIAYHSHFISENSTFGGMILQAF